MTRSGFVPASPQDSAQYDRDGQFRKVTPPATGGSDAEGAYMQDPEEDERPRLSRIYRVMSDIRSECLQESGQRRSDHQPAGTR
jgi:hypothetical protein